MFNVLKPTKQKKSRKKVFGFDIETYNKNKSFYCASLYSDDVGMYDRAKKKDLAFRKTFFNKKGIIDEFRKRVYNGAYIAATNLSFDFFGLFFKSGELKNFKFIMRGSSLISARTFVHNGKFYRKSFFMKNKKIVKCKGSLTFIDTGNYASLSVEKLGKLVKCKKLESPEFIGKKPRNKEQKEYMVKYNMRDSEISYKAIKFLFRSFEKLGATPKMTIASTAMSLFKNKYLKDKYFGHNVEDLIKLFKGYYGGRVEAFGRGHIEEYKYYDINSLYPSVMINQFPDPNSMRKTYKNTITYIKSYHGVSHVDIYCPKMHYPLLPHRKDNKLLFPYGNFSGWYSHIELRKALKLGYKIKKVHETIYFVAMCRPFDDFVKDLYTLRKKLKKKKDVMEYVVKIVMNSLYGKFGQKFWDKDDFIHKDAVTLEMLDKKGVTPEPVGDFFRFKKGIEQPASFCFPEWALHITAYARLKLYDYIISEQPIYVDTDSLITRTELKDSPALGELKLEADIIEGMIIKPKFYALNADIGSFVKAKGVGKKLKYEELINKLHKNNMRITFRYDKFTKFKEAIRRKLTPNQILKVEKKMELTDDKRVWEKPLSLTSLELSEPVFVDETRRELDKITVKKVKGEVIIT